MGCGIRETTTLTREKANALELIWVGREGGKEGGRGRGKRCRWVMEG